jgi:hypothetical protein
MIESPVIIIGCPRSGTTLLFNMLSEVPSLWSMGQESKEIIERFHHPRQKDWVSGALDADDLTEQSRRYMLHAFEVNSAPGTWWRQVNGLRSRLRQNALWQSIKRHGRTERGGAAITSAMPARGMSLLRTLVHIRNRLLPRGSGPIRLLEKTPENCLRLPFLLALFPDARIIFLSRDGRSNISSLIEGWRQPHLFPGYRVPLSLAIPGYHRDRWAFTLIPGWQALGGNSLEEVCAWQWIRCNEAVLDFLEATAGRIPHLVVRYESIVRQPEISLRRIADFIEIDWDHLAHFSSALPQVNVVSAPRREKWRQENPDEIGRILALIKPMMERLGYDSSSS